MTNRTKVAKQSPLHQFEGYREVRWKELWGIKIEAYLGIPWLDEAL